MKKHEINETKEQEEVFYDEESSDYEQCEDKFIFKMDEDTVKPIVPAVPQQATPTRQHATAQPAKAQSHGYSNILKDFFKSQQSPKHDPNTLRANPTPPKQNQPQSSNYQSAVTNATVKVATVDTPPSKKAETQPQPRGIARTKTFTSYTDLQSLIDEESTPEQTYEPNVGILRSIFEYFYPEEDQDTYSP